jgi:hypothetical protein
VRLYATFCTLAANDLAHSAAVSDRTEVVTGHVPSADGECESGANVAPVPASRAPAGRTAEEEEEEEAGALYGLWTDKSQWIMCEARIRHLQPLSRCRVKLSQASTNLSHIDGAGHSYRLAPWGRCSVLLKGWHVSRLARARDSACVRASERESLCVALFPLRAFVAPSKAGRAQIAYSPVSRLKRTRAPLSTIAPNPISLETQGVDRALQLVSQGERLIQVVFDFPQRAVAPGQVCSCPFCSMPVRTYPVLFVHSDGMVAHPGTHAGSGVLSQRSVPRKRPHTCSWPHLAWHLARFLADVHVR